MLEKERSARMTNCPPHDPRLYVERQPVTNDLITHLLKQITDARYKRSLILEGSSGSGKSWLVGDISRRCTSNLQDQHVRSIVNNNGLIVFCVNRDDIRPNPTQPFNQPEELFLPVVNTLLTIVQQQYPALASQFPASIQKWVDIQSDLTSMITALNTLPAVPYILILFDGMEEVLEDSHRMAAYYQNASLQQNTLLYRFEKICLLPLFKYENVRLLATRRADVDAQWRTFTVKQRTHVWSLPDFSTADPIQPTGNGPVLEQFARKVVERGLRLSITEIQDSLSALQAQLPNYGWENAGANDCLMDAWLQQGQISKAVLDTCIDALLNSPTGNQLPQKIKEQLFGLIQHKPRLHKGASRSQIELFLQPSNVSPTDFVSEIQSRGIGFFDQIQFKIYPHIIALIQEWQQRP